MRIYIKRISPFQCLFSNLNSYLFYKILTSFQSLKFLTFIHLCGELNMYGPHRLTCLNTWPIGSSNIRRCALVEVDVWGSVSLWGKALRSHFSSYSVAHSLLLPVDPAPSPAPCQPTCQQISLHGVNGLSLLTVSQPQLNVFQCKICHGNGVSSQQ